MLNGMNFEISEKIIITFNDCIIFLHIFAFTKQISFF
jgi:hypothetical protein